MAEDLVCSFHVLPFLTLQEVGRLQGACRALDDDFRCPETRVERLSNFAPRAVALAAPSLEHVALSRLAGARVVFNGFDEGLPRAPPAVVAIADALKRHPRCRVLVDAPCGCGCAIAWRRAAAVRYVLTDDHGVAWDRISVTGRPNSRRQRNAKLCRSNVATVYLQLREKDALYEYPPGRGGGDDDPPARSQWVRRRDRPPRPRTRPPQGSVRRILWYLRRSISRAIFVLKWELPIDDDEADVEVTRGC